MLNQNDIIKFLDNHYSDLQARFNVSKIGLFGSFARNEQNEESDIEYLKSTFHRDVELCREKYLKPYIKDYLDKEVIYV